VEPGRKGPLVIVELNPDEIEAIVMALDQNDAYLISQHREDDRYRNLADKLIKSNFSGEPICPPAP